MLLLDSRPNFDMRRQTFGISDHFEDALVSGDRWTVTTENSGAVNNIDGAGGQITIVSGATDNNETYLESTKEIFLFANGKPLRAACRIKYSEASGSAANVGWGLMNAPGADSILDDGAGLKASYSGASFYKVDGGTNWIVEASLATTRYGQTTLTAANSLDKLAKAAAGSSFQWHEIEVVPISSTQARVDFFIDSVHVASTLMTYTSATEMALWAGVKTGSGNALTATIDYLGCEQKL